ncbi:glycosyltransferase [Marivirga sp.]|uniref:glycosyltransferase n=1 Tax=Marivirga sp. TaxID=2018662 RepID=UPI0025E14F9D|nr:glycosyltransferase [Marivirga sp.]
MKILFFNHDSNLGGASRALVELIDGLQGNDVNCMVVLPSRGPLCNELEKKSIEYSIMRYSKWTGQPKYLFKKQPLKYIKQHLRFVKKLLITIRSVFYLHRLLKPWNPDLIITNTSVIYFGYVYSVIYRQKHIWHLREFLDHGLHLIVPKSFFYFLLKLSSGVVFTSFSLKSHTLPEYKKGYVIYDGPVSKEDFNRRKVNIHDGIFKFVIIGIIDENKNQKEAIKALSLLIKQGYNVSLNVVGRGNYKPLKDLAENLKISSFVHFSGYLDDPFSAYYNANSLLICSKSEGFGRVIIEAMAFGIAVIGYDNGRGTSELITHQYNGLLYKNAEAGLAEQMKIIIDNRNLREIIENNAWEHARKYFTKDSHVKNFENLIMEL